MNFKKGTKVYYHKIVKSDGTKMGTMETEIVSEAWQLSHGEWVIKLKGQTGGISLNHIEIIKNG